MKIALASDHGGFELKEKVKTFLSEDGHEVFDLGTNNEESVDYPIYGEALGKFISEGKADFGIAFCGTGIGISIACNKVKGIRCALLYSAQTAKMAKEHNNANIIAIGGRTTSFDDAKEYVKAFMNAEFEGGRHQKRLDEISRIETVN
jgi:ribose 5-phosphate isomerase B